MKLPSMWPFIRRKKKLIRRRRIFLWLCISGGAAIVIAAVLIPVLLIKPTFGNFKLSNDLPKDLIIDYESPVDATLRTDINKKDVSLTFELPQDKNLDGHLSLVNPQQESCGLHLDSGLIDGSYEYSIIVMASKNGYVDKQLTFDFGLKVSLHQFSNFTINVTSPTGIIFDYYDNFTWDVTHSEITNVDGTPVDPDSIDWSLQEVTSSIQGKLQINQTTGQITLLTGAGDGDYSYKVRAIAHKDKYEDKEITTQAISLHIGKASYNDFFVSQSDDAPNVVWSGYNACSWQANTNCFPAPTLGDHEYSFVDIDVALSVKLAIDANLGSINLLSGLAPGVYHYKIRLAMHKNGYINKTVDSEEFTLEVSSTIPKNIDGSDWEGHDETSSETLNYDYDIPNNTVTYRRISSGAYHATDLVIPDVVYTTINYIPHYFTKIILFEYCFSKSFNPNYVLTGHVNTGNAVIEIGIKAFQGQTGMTDFVLGANVKSVGKYTSIIEGVFKGCTNLGSFVINGKVEDVGGLMFENCPSLISSTGRAPNKIWKNTTDNLYYLGNDATGYWCLGYGFSGSTGTKPTGEVTIMDNTIVLAEVAFDFLGNENITKIIFNNQLKYISNIACTELGNLQSMIVLPNSILKIGDSAFESLRVAGLVANLPTAQLTIPNGCQSIGNKAFYNLMRTTTILTLTLPNTLTKIGDYAFSGSDSSSYNNGFTGDLVILDGIESIGDGCFKVNKFDKIVLGHNTTVIGSEAFKANVPWSSSAHHQYIESTYDSQPNFASDSFKDLCGGGNVINSNPNYTSFQFRTYLVNNCQLPGNWDPTQP